MLTGHAEIAGAGVAGLVAAAALAQRGWSVCVHERTPDLRSFGAGISCWYNFVKVLKAVGAAEEAATNCRPFYIRETRDERNRVLYTIRASEKPHEQTFTLTRRHLIHSLANAARRAGAEILTSWRVVGADPSGALLLENGTRRRADHGGFDQVEVGPIPQIGLDDPPTANQLAVHRDAHGEAPLVASSFGSRTRL